MLFYTFLASNTQILYRRQLRFNDESRFATKTVFIENLERISFKFI